MADEEAHWALQLLETSIQDSGLSERQLEKRLGWGKGTLGKILHDGGALEHQQILDILAVLARDGRAGGNGGEPMVGTLLERFSRLGYPLSAPRAVAPPPEGAELERKVEEILAEAFGRLEAREEEEE